MVNLPQKIKAELENINEIFNELPPHYKLPELSTLELAGVAALLHNFYNGIENIWNRKYFEANLHIAQN